MSSVLRSAAKSLALSLPPVRRLFDDRNRIAAERAALAEQVQLLQIRLEAQSALVNRNFMEEAAGPEVAFRLFAGTWSCFIPGFGLGAVPTFEDTRVRWMEERLGGFQGKRVLELGPLEGGHAYMLARGGAAHVTSIESNQIAFLKCLIVKNALHFDTDFLLGDFRPFLARTQETWDFVLACGVLYHMSDPVALLADLARVTPVIGLWTHYYDEAILRGNPRERDKHTHQPEPRLLNGKTFPVYRYNYGVSLDWQGFCGGSAAHCYWLSRASLIGCLESLGYEVDVGHDQLEHPNGPAILLLARRPAGA